MLELIMTRQSESWLRNSLEKNLQFLVYDELHTYRGRQGADVSYLNRRIQANCKNEIICIGTSATMASDGSPDDKKRAVAKVAAKIFGKEYTTGQIVGEYLETCTKGINPTAFELAESIKKEINHDWDEATYIGHPITNWLEINIALKSNHDQISIPASPGAPLYVSTNAGKVTEVAPAVSGDIVRLVGHNVWSATSPQNTAIIRFQPDNTWIEL
jgi:hypothetical protein